MSWKQRLAEQKQIEAARMQNVLLLLQDLFKREEATVKRVLGLLYDVGSLHVINEKVPIRYLNKPLRVLAKLSKPVFGFVAIRWFQANCPKLIADWLYTVATFQPPENQQQPSTVATQGSTEVAEADVLTADLAPSDRPTLTAQKNLLQIEPQVQPRIEPSEVSSGRSPLPSSELAELSKLAESLQSGLQQMNWQEIQRLRQQLRWMLGGAIAAMVFAGALGVWLGYHFKAGSLEEGFNDSNPASHQKLKQR
ncbi:MAG: hypothetical protein VKJ46_05755 [Leptolyngbyaceae bacterium]|nr:hypothetical protein [Leptolyngbyaceae bacterium]